MADLGTGIKGIWLKGMEAIGNAASSIASSTKSKVGEINLVNRRNEILKDFGNQAYVLWQKGARFPDELEVQLKELEKLDEQLNDLRAERLAGVKTEEGSDNQPDGEDAAESKEDSLPVSEEETEETAEIDEPGEFSAENPENVVPVISTEQPDEAPKPVSDLSSTISDLFESAPTAEEAAEKVNSALDSLEDGLKQFSQKIDDTLVEVSDQISDGKPEDPKL